MSRHGNIKIDLPNSEEFCVATDKSALCSAAVKKFWQTKPSAERSRIMEERAKKSGSKAYLVREFVLSQIPKGSESKLSFSPEKVRIQLQALGESLDYQVIQQVLKRLRLAGLIRMTTVTERAFKEGCKKRDSSTTTVAIRDFILKLIPKGQFGKISFSNEEIRTLLESDGYHDFTDDQIRKAMRTLLENGTLRLLTWQERIAVLKKTWQNFDEDKRAEISEKTGEGKTHTKSLLYLDSLLFLNLLTGREFDALIFDYLNKFAYGYVVSSKTKWQVKGWKRFGSDSSDMFQEFSIAIMTAIKKWDGISDLDDLVVDSILLHLSRLNRKEKRDALYSWNLVKFRNQGSESALDILTRLGRLILESEK